MSNFFKLNIAKIVPYLIGAFLFFSFEVEAQFQKSWDMFYGGSSYDEMRRIIELDDGYLLFGSASYSTSGDIGSTHGSSDYWVQKIDFNGNLIWNKLFGGLDTDILQDAIMDDEGNFVMVGYSESNKSGNKSSSGKGGRDFWVVKIDPDGSKLWDKTFGGLSKDYGTSLIQSQSGNYIIGGWTTSPYGFDIKKTPLGHFDYFVFEVTKNGKIGWQNRFGGTKEDRCLDLCEDKEGNIYLAGLSKSEDNGNKKAKLLGRIDYWIVKIDADGKKIWGKTYGGTSEDKPTDITVLNNGNILISGFSASDKTPTKSDYNKGIVDSWLLCIDPDGDRVWDKSFGGTGADEVGEVEELGNGNLIVYGYSSTDGDGDKTENSFGKSDYWIFILDENRDIIYEASFGGDDIDICTSGLMSKNGDIVITGLSKSSASGNLTTENNGIQDVLVVSLECDLNVKLLKDTSLCIGEELLLEPEHNSKVGVSFEWDNGLTTQSRVIEVVDDETILLTTTDVFGCVFNNNVNILASESPVFDLGTDKEICGDSTFYLGVASGLGEYLWSNGETSTTISVQTTGVYDLVVTNSIGCSHEDEIAIIFHDIPVFDLGKNESLCAGETKKLTIPFQDGSYLWYPSGRTARSNIVNTTGVYVAEYTDQYGCSSLDSFQLTVNPIPSVDLGKDTTICEGDRIHLINYSNCEGCD